MKRLVLLLFLLVAAPASAQPLNGRRVTGSPDFPSGPPTRDDMPQLVGLDAADARRVLQNTGVAVSGPATGRVLEQTPAPGAPLGPVTLGAEPTAKLAVTTKARQQRAAVKRRGVRFSYSGVVDGARVTVGCGGRQVGERAVPAGDGTLRVKTHRLPRKPRTQCRIVVASGGTFQAAAFKLVRGPSGT